MFLYGYTHLLVLGTMVTLKVALFSLFASFMVGLFGAVAKLSSNRILVWFATAYTTLIRGIPSLVMMLLIYYGFQIGLNDLTDKLGWHQIDIDPMFAAVLTLAVIYGAYFTETFRGAYLAVARGQMEAALAIGMSWPMAFRRIQFPQLMRIALPGITNNWLVLTKSAGLVSLLGLNDMVKAAQQAGNTTGQQFLFYCVAGLVFLMVTTVSQVVLIFVERRYDVGVRRARL